MLNRIERLIEGDRLDRVSKGRYRNNSWVGMHIPIWAEIWRWRMGIGRHCRYGRYNGGTSELLSNHVVRKGLRFYGCSAFTRILCLLDTI
jgi:hypothetical protein